MPSSDWDDLKTNISWSVPSDARIKVSTTHMACDGYFQPSPRFQATFPCLTRLLNLARVTEFKCNKEKFVLFGWTDSAGKSLGWQCLPPEPSTKLENVFPDHALLLSCFGGILHRWHEPESSWLFCHKYALTRKGIRKGFNGWEECYLDQCKEDNISPPADPDDYRTFAVEWNGNSTAYHRQTGSVLMFAHDHCFKHIKKLPGSPHNTLFTINNCPDFRTWVETLASQWAACAQIPH